MHQNNVKGVQLVGDYLFFPNFDAVTCLNLKTKKFTFIPLIQQQYKLLDSLHDFFICNDNLYCMRSTVGVGKRSMTNCFLQLIDDWKFENAASKIDADCIPFGSLCDPQNPRFDFRFTSYNKRVLNGKEIDLGDKLTARLNVLDQMDPPILSFGTNGTFSIRITNKNLQILKGNKEETSISGNFYCPSISKRNIVALEFSSTTTLHKLHHWSIQDQTIQKNPEISFNIPSSLLALSSFLSDSSHLIRTKYSQNEGIFLVLFSQTSPSNSEKTTLNKPRDIISFAESRFSNFHQVFITELDWMKRNNTFMLCDTPESPKRIQVVYSQF
jgi:hypothetical protein